MNTDYSEMTFAQLRKMVGNELYRGKVPGIRQLREENRKVILKDSYGDSFVTVYEGGVILYESTGRSTVMRIEECTRLVYGFSTGETKEINEAELDGMFYFWPICMAGENRISENSFRNERKKVLFSMSDDSNVYIRELEAPDVESKYMEKAEQRINEELVTDLLKLVTSKAQKVVRLSFLDERQLTDAEIAALMGISPRSVYEIRKRALDKLRKLM